MGRRVFYVIKLMGGYSRHIGIHPHRGGEGHTMAQHLLHSMLFLLHVGNFHMQRASRAVSNRN